MEFAILGGLALLGYIYKENWNQHADVEVQEGEGVDFGIVQDGFLTPKQRLESNGWTPRQGRSSIREPFKDDDVPLLMSDDSLATKFYTQRTVTTFSDDYKQSKLDLYTGNSQSMFNKPQRSEKEALFKPVESATLISFSGKPTTTSSPDTERYWVNPNADFTQPAGIKPTRDLPMGYASQVRPNNPSSRQPKILPHPLNGHAMVPFSAGPEDSGAQSDSNRLKKELSSPFAAPASLATGASQMMTEFTPTRDRSTPDPHEYYGAASSAGQGEAHTTRPSMQTTKAQANCGALPNYFGNKHLSVYSGDTQRAVHSNEVSSSRLVRVGAEFLPQSIAKGSPALSVNQRGKTPGSTSLSKRETNPVLRDGYLMSALHPDAQALLSAKQPVATSRATKNATPPDGDKEDLMPTRVLINPAASDRVNKGGLHAIAVRDVPPESSMEPVEMTMYSARFGHGGIANISEETSKATIRRERIPSAVSSTLEHVFSSSTQRIMSAADYRMQGQDSPAERDKSRVTSAAHPETMGQARALEPADYRMGEPSFVHRKSNLTEHIQEMSSTQKKLLDLMPDNRSMVITLPTRDAPQFEDGQVSRQNKHVDFAAHKPPAMAETFIGVNLGSKPPMQQDVVSDAGKRSRLPETIGASSYWASGVNSLSNIAAQMSRSTTSESRRDKGRPDAPTKLGGNSIIPASVTYTSTAGPQRAEQAMPQSNLVGRIQGAPGHLADSIGAEETRFRQEISTVAEPRGMKVQAPQSCVKPPEDLPRTKVSNITNDAFPTGILANGHFIKGGHIDSEITKVPDKDSRSQLPYGHAHTSLTTASIVTEDIVNNTRVPDKPLASSTPGPQVNNHAAVPSAGTPPPTVVETYKTSHETSSVGSHSTYYNPLAPPSLPFKLTREKKIEEIASAFHDMDPTDHPLQNVPGTSAS